MDSILTLNNHKVINRKEAIQALYNSTLESTSSSLTKVKMQINFIACLFIILCAPVLIISSLPIQNKLPSSFFLDLLDEHQVNETGATVIHSNEEDSSDPRTAYAVLKYEIVNSKKSQGKRGSGGGNNVVRQPKLAKSNAVPLLEVLKSFYFSVCISCSLFIVLSF